MKEEIIKIRCVSCGIVRFANKKDWDEGKIFRCFNCDGVRFTKL